MNYLYQEWNGAITNRHMGIRKLIKEHYIPYYAHKFKNLEVMDKFLQKTQTTQSYTRK